MWSNVSCDFLTNNSCGLNETYDHLVAIFLLPVRFIHESLFDDPRGWHGKHIADAMQLQ